MRIGAAIRGAGARQKDREEWRIERPIISRAGHVSGFPQWNIAIRAERCSWFGAHGAGYEARRDDQQKKVFHDSSLLVG
jgi:hypothetical protein